MLFIPLSRVLLCVGLSVMMSSRLQHMILHRCSSTARMPMNLPNQAAVLHIGTAGGLSSPHKQTQRPQHSRRQRRHSSNGVTFAPKPQYIQEGWVLRAYPTVAFSMKGAIQVSGGVSVTEALGLGSATKPNATKMRLSLNEHYSPNFFHPNEEGRVTVRLAWDRYGSQDYHISLDASSGRVNLNKFVRHIARGCEEFVTRFRIPVHLDRLRLHYIEETSRGIWSLKLSVAPL
ncbi:hypothetical protein DL96DRAFT_955250 [Flagelloscypha sp. PMI_526]|nr:hypothetical protein DL96DRAFT_955250 [Flagelloscypha sp. PMI_526]